MEGGERNSGSGGESRSSLDIVFASFRDTERIVEAAATGSGQRKDLKKQQESQNQPTANI